MGWLSWVILCIVVFTLLKLYVFLPFRIRKENWISAAPEFISVNASDSRIPDSTFAFFRDVAAQLEPVGFTPATWVFSPDSYKGVTAYLAIFENLGDKVAAAAVVAISETPTGVSTATYVVDIETTFADGTNLSTSNDPSSSPYPPPPWRRGYRFARMADLGLLYRIHRHLAAIPGTSAKEALPVHDDVVRSLRESIDREYAEHVRTGHIALAENGREYYQTIKGAYRAVWCLLWPLKHIIRSRNAKAARRVLRELGLPLEYETVDYVAKYKGVEDEIETAELVEE